MKIIMGNKRYSSWSLRGWLAMKQSGFDFDEVVVPMDTDEWFSAKKDPDIMPSGKVPVVWDDTIAVWDSLAIIDWLADRVGRDRYWPQDAAARALARSMAAEMHSGFVPLRQHCPMNTVRTYRDFALTPEVAADIARIDALWSRARQTYGAGGDFLFGDFGAADIMYAPVVSRIHTYGIAVANADYVSNVLAQPWMKDWYTAAAAEDWILDRVEF